MAAISSLSSRQRSVGILTLDDSTLQVELARGARVHVEVQDLAGATKAVLYSGCLPSGRHDVYWLGVDQEGRFVPSGTYVLMVYGTAGDASCEFQHSR